MREALLTFGQPNDWTFTPIGLILRFSEGIDSLRNLARSSNGDLTVDERAAALVCSTAQLGGLLFSIVASTFALFSLAFIPVFVAIGVCCCQMAAATRRRRAATRGASKKPPKRSKGPAYQSLKGSDDDSAPAAAKRGASAASAPASESKSGSRYTQIVDGYVYESGKKRRKATKAEIKEVEDEKKQVEDVRQQIEKARQEALRRSEKSNRSRRSRPPPPPPPPRGPGVPPPPPPPPPPLEDVEDVEDGGDEDGPPPSLQRAVGSSDLNVDDDEEVGDLGFGGGRNFREEAQEEDEPRMSVDERLRAQAAQRKSNTWDQEDYARERAEQEEPEFAPFLNTRLPTFQFRRV